MTKILVGVILFLLFAVNFLAFHDVFEQHTVRDWLMLTASVFIFVYFITAFLRERLKKIA